MQETRAQQNVKAFSRLMNNQELRLHQLFLEHKTKIFFGSLVLFLSNIIIVALPSLVNIGVALIEGKSEKNFDLFFWQINFKGLYSVVIAIVLLAILGAIIRTLSRVLIFDVGRVAERDIRAHLLNHISALDDKFLNQNQVGDLMSHLTNDISNIRMMAGFALLNILNIISVFILSVPLLFKIDVILAFAALLPFPLVVLSTRSLTRKMFDATRAYQEKLSSLVDHVQENLSGAQVVRLFHQQQAENQRFLITNKSAYEAAIHLAKLRVLMFPIMRMVIGLTIAILLLLGGYAVATGRVRVGDFVEINARVMQLTWPAISIGFVISVISRGRASFSRINRLLAIEPAICDGQDELLKLKSIDVIDLKLNPKAKTKINFKLKKGQILGLAGPSGSYKTTLLKYLYRRIPVEPGSIFFDEHDLVNLSLKSIYQHVAVVNQEPFLFHKSIKENLILFRPEALEEEINKIVTMVKLDKDIQSFEHGLNTVIGERGITLSGGQRQRVALGRALLAERSLIILDDALSAVDAETEKYIVNNIVKNFKKSMLIISTHRLSILKNADHILVLEKGEVQAQGQHDELLENNRLYSELNGVSYDR